MRYLCPICGSIMHTISTASIPPTIIHHCLICGFKSKPIKEEKPMCDYLPKELWAEEGENEIQHN